MSKRITTQSAKQRILQNYHGKIELMSECTNAKQIVRLRCVDCGFEWDANIAHYIRISKFTQSPCASCRYNQIRYVSNCATCGKQIIKLICHRSQSGKDYCSHTCRAKASNHPQTNDKSKKSCKCLCCGEQLDKFQRKFCNTSCQQKYYNDQYIDNWLSGKQTGLSGSYQISQRVRKYMIQQADGKCEECGWSVVNQHTGVVPLQIHHVDGNYKNNRPENLKVLCPCCHALTSTYKGLNRGNGRCERIHNP